MYRLAVYPHVVRNNTRASYVLASTLRFHQYYRKLIHVIYFYIYINMDTRDHLNVVFIGHVDAGKSTIAGQLLLLMGMVDPRTLDKYEKLAKELGRDSWYLAYILDTNKEERARGKTVEVGRAYFSTDKRRFTILDAPGHKDYVPKMIGGAAQADVAILVISARKGEFEAGFTKGGQTKEHAMLAKTLGVNRLIVLVNKMDEKTVMWDQGRFEHIRDTLMPYLSKIGFKKNVIFMPVSGLTKANLKECTEWYKGPSLITILEQIELPKRNGEGLRVPVLDRYKDAGKVIIEGKVEMGTLKIGQTVFIMPTGDSGEVTYLGTDLDERAECGPGENVRVVIKGIRLKSIATGCVITDQMRSSVTEFEAEIYVVGLLKHKPIFSPGYEAMLHVHTATEVVKVVSVNQRFVQKGGTAIVRLRTKRPICVDTYKDCGQLGRFTIRDEEKTIVIGKIIEM